MNLCIPVQKLIGLSPQVAQINLIQLRGQCRLKQILLLSFPLADPEHRAPRTSLLPRLYDFPHNLDYSNQCLTPGLTIKSLDKFSSHMKSTVVHKKKLPVLTPTVSHEKINWDLLMSPRSSSPEFPYLSYYDSYLTTLTQIRPFSPPLN